MRAFAVASLCIASAGATSITSQALFDELVHNSGKTGFIKFQAPW